MSESSGRPRILVGGSALFSDGGLVPRPLAKSRLALERLHALGDPVVLVGPVLGGRALPADEGERVAWVRACLDMDRLRIAAFDEGETGRPADPGANGATDRWADLRAEWGADTLLSTFESSVGPARRCGLRVIRIGARGPAADPTAARADYEAFDLLDAVRHLLTADTFDRPGAPGEGSGALAPGTAQPDPRLAAALVPVSGGPATATRPDLLDGGQPGEG